ncbi:hypothetical protein K439DRAFT_1633920 [Ramaria rubella]|nr:hypothetical protein K439DRAFT_1633920 [Ramaria rubella]
MAFARRSWSTLHLFDPFQRVNPALLYRLAHLRPQNEDIKYETVQVVNSEGKLDPPIPLTAVLASIDRKKFCVRLVADDKPIVKVLNKQDEYAKVKALRKAQKGTIRTEDKEIQMTWGVASGDLAHKVTKVRRELEKKNRVDLIFAPKKKQPLPSQNERDAKVQEVLEMLRDIGKESRPRTSHKSLLTLHLQNKPLDTES